jgi:hypothetical protein
MLPHWRLATWLLVAYNVVMPGAALAGAPYAGQVWILGTAVLGVVWLVSHPRRRHCPRCRSEVARTYVVCPHCRHEFYAPMQPRRQGV